MITDIHCHYVPDQFFKFARSRPEFSIAVKRQEGDAVDLDIRGMHFGLNTTFFQMEKQLERMRRDGVERAMLSQATPFIDYHLDAVLATGSRDRLQRRIGGGDCAGSHALRGLGAAAHARPGGRRQRIAPLVVREHRFIGGHIASNVRGHYLNDPQFTPVVEAAVELGVPLFVHPADPLGKRTARAITSSQSWRVICSTARSTS